MRAFLQYNSAYEIVLFNDYAQMAFGPSWKPRAPLWLWGRGHTLWLKKVQ